MKQKVITHRIGWGWLSDLDLSFVTGTGHRVEMEVSKVLGLGPDQYGVPCFYLLLVEKPNEQ